ncbi:hypothetical protein AXF42_Ash008695 [Apostasia shenzhenica]|uniref:Uncharacterized protein n=1 Tax=Apostasia shenzhenica TaxID=1088818 RepID=A0A2I0B238_9ASPA|nr:hypothetical protein AXF42_Ash008695 [Apostasia shenzhenica]
MHSSHSSCRGDTMAREENDGIKTVECLRGRLLAERVASKSAKAEADHIAKRLAELETQLEEEIKHRERAEKRLNQALKKLESLKMLDFRGNLSLSDSSTSSSSSAKCFSSNVGLEKWKESAGEDLLGDSTHQLLSQDGSWSSTETASSRNREAPQGDGASSGIGSMEFTVGTLRQSSADRHKLGCDDDLTEHDAEQSLALVPVSQIQEPASSNPVEKNDAHQVLVALRHLREQLQASLGRRGVAACLTEEPYGRRLASATAMEAASTK